MSMSKDLIANAKKQNAAAHRQGQQNGQFRIVFLQQQRQYNADQAQNSDFSQFSHIVRVKIKILPDRTGR